MTKSIKPILILCLFIFLIILFILGLGEAFSPLIISFGISYLLFPIIRKLEEKGINRSVALLSVFTIISILLILSLTFIIPHLFSEGRDFFLELPRNISKAIEKIEFIASGLNYQIDLSKDNIGSYIQEHISSLSSSFLTTLTTALKGTFTGLIKWIIGILNLFLIPLFFFYVIRDYEEIIKEIKSFVPKSWLSKLTYYTSISNNVLNGYIRGQLLVAFALAILYAFGLSLIGLRFGLLIGLGSGLISIIPYAGFTIGFITAIVIGLANYTGINLIIGISLVFIIVQALESLIITPKLVGDKVGLSAFATMLALIVGGNLFGLIGMLIGIPIAGILKIIIPDLREELLNEIELEM